MEAVGYGGQRGTLSAMRMRLPKFILDPDDATRKAWHHYDEGREWLYKHARSDGSHAPDGEGDLPSFAICAAMAQAHFAAARLTLALGGRRYPRG